ncbi:MAG TPA: hypothetical protein P5134_06420 [Bacteroidales bacterium]|jgi:hypothetical protein|nr:hypothetical protein [Bacteroidales bacterium]HOF46312.1 hypothetical protein [Bacteroidales bacterium]HRR04306.1 hypothetical protein [Bacteroidales bacterium]HRT14225.1 hypothetical protein [Bacteroidales bacterium]HXK73750.1 hypothetical protein [Bacteroidales bacterium]
MIKKINESPITTLQIVKPDIIKNFYEIKLGDDLYGTLDIMKNSVARVETQESSFLLERFGFFKPYITVTDEKLELIETTAYLDIKLHTRIVLNEMPFYFKMINLWKNQWGWTNEKNQLVLKYKPIIAGTIKGDIEFLKDFFYVKNLELLTLIGIYFLIQLEEESR